MTKPAFNVNNFDLVRLFAAGQVAMDHGLTHLLPEFEGSALAGVLACIPGVPVFFFVSGFLVSKSWEVSKSPGQYARNRFLRLYPGLIACVLLSIALVTALGYPRTSGASAGDLLLWLAAQLSFVQFYNPDFLRGFGTGVLNGSLWTISVELQFYVLVPLLYAALRPLAARSREFMLVILVLVFIVCNQLFLALGPAHGEELTYKLVKVSFVPWFYMFLVGVLVQRHLPAVLAVVEGRFLPFRALYVIVVTLLAGPAGASLGNAIGPLP
ncbi:MAG: acyltransferase [Gammaproteobacteria bacterium]